LALACHHRICVDHPKILLGQPEVTIGLLPGAGGTQRLPRLIGVEPALEMMIKGRHINPARAVELGVVHELVRADQLLDAARTWLCEVGDAEQPWDKKGFKVPGGAGAMHPKAAQTFMVGTALVAKQTKHNYPAPIAILSAVFEGTIVPMDTALTIEARYFLGLLRDPVAKNMIRTLFVHKQAADKLARRPADVPRLDVGKVGILGAGLMGEGIAYAAAMAGIEVVLLDTHLDRAEQGKDYSRGLLAKGVERDRLTKDAANAALQRIKPTVDYADLAGAELVIEAVFEDRSIKADVTAQAEAQLAPDAIFASNTSTLPISGLAEASERPANFIGLHFFSPVDKMPLVEVIVGEQTSQTCIAHALDFVQKLRKTPIVVNDSRGFYTSRVFGTFAAEGMAMLAEGVNPALIENGAKQAGMPVGPLAVSDEVSIELQYKIHKQSAADLGEDYTPGPADEVARHFVEDLGRLGKRAGAGFYEYPEGAKKRLWPGLAREYPRAEDQPTVEKVKQRLLYVQALETARCFEEGVLTNAADGDIGSIFGWGFPAYTGGTLSFIDTVGIQRFVAECAQLAREHGARFQPSSWLQERAERGARFHGGSGTTPKAA
jgi:3-hydroxyacyl-CoA dehydrogenase/enoyl-CoA hydratase/3-hydroxybutyryl-CoA epimerase